MLTEQITITNEQGLHLRPTNLLCQEALNYQCSIKIKVREKEANAKSLLNVLAAQVKQGDTITLVCNGEDEEEAMNAVKSLLEHGLGDF